MYKTRQRSERRKEQPKKKTTFKAGCKHKIEMIPRLDVGLFLSVSFSITEVPVCIKGTNFLASGKILIVFNTPSECSKKVDVTRLQDQLYMEFYIPLGITQTSTLIIGLASRISSIPLDVPETEAFISWIISMISKIPSDLKTPAAFVLGRVFFKYVAPKEPEEANEPESKPEPKEESDGEEMDPFCRLNMLLHKVPACLRVDPFLIKGLDGQHFLVSGQFSFKFPMPEDSKKKITLVRFPTLIYMKFFVPLNQELTLDLTTGITATNSLSYLDLEARSALLTWMIIVILCVPSDVPKAEVLFSGEFALFFYDLSEYEEEDISFKEKDEEPIISEPSDKDLDLKDYRDCSFEQYEEEDVSFKEKDEEPIISEPSDKDPDFKDYKDCSFEQYKEEDISLKEKNDEPIISEPSDKESDFKDYGNCSFEQISEDVSFKEKNEDPIISEPSDKESDFIEDDKYPTGQCKTFNHLEIIEEYGSEESTETTLQECVTSVKRSETPVKQSNYPLDRRAYDFSSFNFYREFDTVNQQETLEEESEDKKHKTQKRFGKFFKNWMKKGFYGIRKMVCCGISPKTNKSKKPQ